MIAGYTYNEPAAFLAFDPSATSPPAPTVPGTEGLACGIKREVLYVAPGETGRHIHH